MIKTLQNTLKQDREGFVLPKSVQDAIPIRRLWPDGIFQFGSKFSKTIRFSDINYAIASKEDKTSMFLGYSELLNALDTGSTTKLTINNKRLNRQDFEQKILLPRQDDYLDGYRAEYNAMLMDKVTDSSNSVVQERYITLSVHRKSIEEARTFFDRVTADVTTRLSHLDAHSEELDAVERLRVLHDFYRTGEETEFHVDLRELMRKGHSFKDSICPDSLEFKKDYFVMGDKFGRVLFLKEYASYIKDSMVSELTVNANLKMSIFAETKCNFSPVSTEVYTALIHQFTCRFEARQALIYQLVLGLTGENGKYNYSRAVHVYPLFFDITCSAKNYKIAPALTGAPYDLTIIPDSLGLHPEITEYPAGGAPCNPQHLRNLAGFISQTRQVNRFPLSRGCNSQNTLGKVLGLHLDCRTLPNIGNDVIKGKFAVVRLCWYAIQAQPLSVTFSHIPVLAPPFHKDRPLHADLDQSVNVLFFGRVRIAALPLNSLQIPKNHYIVIFVWVQVFTLKKFVHQVKILLRHLLFLNSERFHLAHVVLPSSPSRVATSTPSLSIRRRTPSASVTSISAPSMIPGKHSSMARWDAARPSGVLIMRSRKNSLTAWVKGASTSKSIQPRLRGSL